MVLLFNFGRDTLRVKLTQGHKSPQMIRQDRLWSAGQLAAE